MYVDQAKLTWSSHHSRRAWASPHAECGAVACICPRNVSLDCTSDPWQNITQKVHTCTTQELSQAYC